MKPSHAPHALHELIGEARTRAATASRRAAAWTRITVAPTAHEMVGQVGARAAATSRRAAAWTRATAAPAALRAGILYITHSWLFWPVVFILWLAWTVVPAARPTVGGHTTRPSASGLSRLHASLRATPRHPRARTPILPVAPPDGPVDVVRLVRVLYDRSPGPPRVRVITRTVAPGPPRVRVITRTVAPTPTPCASDTAVPPAGPCGYPYMRALAPNPDGFIFHRPSIGIYAIIRLLRQMGSPLATAQTCDDHGSCMSVPAWLWRSGLVRGEDPLVLLAMCYEESHCGRDGEAALNHSLGNMRPLGAADVIHCPAPDSCYHHSDTWGEGIEDAYNLLARYANGQIASDPLTHQPLPLPTLWAAIPTWAPAGDGNDPANYRAATYSIIQAWTGRTY